MNFVRVECEESEQRVATWLDRTAVVMIQKVLCRDRCLIYLRDGTRLTVCLGFDAAYSLLIEPPHFDGVVNDIDKTLGALCEFGKQNPGWLATFAEKFADLYEELP